MVAATVRSLAHMRSLRNYEIVETGSDTEAKVEMVSHISVILTEKIVLHLCDLFQLTLYIVTFSIIVINPCPTYPTNPTTQTLTIITLTPTPIPQVGVQEQRVTGLAIHTLIGMSIIYFRPILRQIPNAVLTGLFLYLGVSSITTTDLWDRFRLFFTDDRDVPKGPAWVKDVTLVRTKIFTAIQMALLGAMWWIKGTKLGVFFPVLIGALAPVRIALEKFNVYSKKELEALDGEIA